MGRRNHSRRAHQRLKYFVSDISYRHKEGECEIPTRAAVMQAQKVLNKKGFKAGSVDGLLGAGTRSAIAKSQEATNTLKVTKNLDRATLIALDINSEIG